MKRLSNRIYLDYAASTPLDKKVEAVMRSANELFGNPSSIHESGRIAKDALNDARLKIGSVISARPEEIVLTGSGSEANNLAVNLEGHVVTTNIEHHSILYALRGREVTYVEVEKNGIVDPNKIISAIRPDTVLVSVQYANNEIGVIQPIKQISKALRLYSSRAIKLFFHTDACQAAGYLPINVQELGVDLMTINGSKIYGPKGVGMLFVRRGTPISPMIKGGSQEYGRRAGTESVALATGLAEALFIVNGMREKQTRKLQGLRDWFISQLPDARLNGDASNRLPNNINVSFDGIDGEMLVLALDSRGVEVSTGAACTVTSVEPSHVLKAIGAIDGGNIRITLGRFTTKKDLMETLRILSEEVRRIRRLTTSPPPAIRTQNLDA